jgi:hypothetical protein
MLLVSVLFLKKKGVVQELLFISTETVTETLSSFSVEEVVKFRTVQAVKRALTLALTSLEVAPTTNPLRAPSSTALSSECMSIFTRPNSTDPRINAKRTGATNANSTAYAPRR